jgi:hypothetical protein
MVAATDLDVLGRCAAGHIRQAGIIQGGTAHLLFVGLNKCRQDGHDAGRDDMWPLMLHIQVSQESRK